MGGVRHWPLFSVSTCPADLPMVVTGTIVRGLNGRVREAMEGCVAPMQVASPSLDRRPQIAGRGSAATTPPTSAAAWEAAGYRSRSRLAKGGEPGQARCFG
jgi:hypothetical protein